MVKIILSLEMRLIVYKAGCMPVVREFSQYTDQSCIPPELTTMYCLSHITYVTVMVKSPTHYIAVTRRQDYISCAQLTPTATWFHLFTLIHQKYRHSIYLFPTHLTTHLVVSLKVSPIGIATYHDGSHKLPRTVPS